MFEFLKRLRYRKEPLFEEQIARCNDSLEGQRTQSSLDDNIALMKKLFSDMDLIRYKEIRTRGREPGRCVLAFCDGMVDAEIIQTNVMKPLMLLTSDRESARMEALLSSVVQVGESKVTDRFQDVVEAITYGDTILFVEGCDQAAILNTRQFVLRSITEPENEKVLGGPREGFTESLISNLSQIIRRLRTNEFKARTLTLGRYTQTSICVCYLDSLVNRKALQELFRRLNTIDMDAILDENYISEIIRDHRYSNFRTTGYTERPDVVVGKLLEGRVAMLVDGSPVVFTIPYLFVENFQSSEDYFYNFYYTSFSRLLRICAFLLTVIVPGFYIAIMAFHQEMLPLQLLMRVALERQSVPLPAALEALIMLLVFDILRETGIRMPANIGQALSIVGALVIGQAAVEASLVAAPMIIMVAATGITGLLVPKLNSPIIFWRLILLLMASAFGFFGLTIGISLLLIHVNRLTSFGVEHVTLKGSFHPQNIKDILVRVPWPAMLERPEGLSDNRVRQAEAGQND